MSTTAQDTFTLAKLATIWANQRNLEVVHFDPWSCEASAQWLRRTLDQVGRIYPVYLVVDQQYGHLIVDGKKRANAAMEFFITKSVQLNTHCITDFCFQDQVDMYNTPIPVVIFKN